MHNASKKTLRNKKGMGILDAESIEMYRYKENDIEEGKVL